MNSTFTAVILIIEKELTYEEFYRLLLITTPEKRERICRYYHYRDARNTLLGDIVARTEICRRTGINNHELVFNTNGYGKPFPVNLPNVHFNISHTRDFIAFAIDDKPIGIDIEIINPIDNKVVQRFFADDEQEYILSAPSNMQLKLFYEIWTMKESQIKREGKGLSKSLPSFSVLDANNNLYYHKIYQRPEVICHTCGEKLEHPNVQVFDLQQYIGYNNL